MPVLQDMEPQGAIDLRHYVVVKATECCGATLHYAFKLVKYGPHVERQYFRCGTENEMIR